MSTSRRWLSVLALVVAAVSAEAQIVSPVNIIPVVSKQAGAQGTNWMTSLTVSNVSWFPVAVEALFFPERGVLLPIFLPTHEFALEAGQSLTVDDLLGSWFPEEGNTKGFLVVSAEPLGGGEEEAQIAITARVFNNANPNATYGQAVGPGLFHTAMGRARSVLPGARSDDRVRSNVGVANLSTRSIAVTVSIFAADGTLAASTTQTVKAFALRQWSLAQLGVASLSPPGRVEVLVDPDTITWDVCAQNLDDLSSLKGVFIAYLSRVDQVTGDAEYIPAQNDWTEYVEECGELPIGGL